MVKQSLDGAEWPDRRGSGPAPARSHVARRELLYQISNFLLDFELDVSPCNLTVAHDVVLGSNAGLGDQITARQLANEPVTQSWLDGVLSEAEQARQRRADAAEREALSPLISSLTEALQQFAQQASQASANALDYHAALLETATWLEAARPMVELPGLSNLTSTMLERARTVEEKMRRLEGELAGLRETIPPAHTAAAMDQITKIDKFWAFDAVLEQECRAARTAGESLSVAICGIDGFEAIRDTHGSGTGDRLIQTLGRGLRRIAAHGSHVRRHDTERYVMLFRGISPDHACQKLNKVREEFAQRTLIDRKTEFVIGNVSFSGGLADVFDYPDLSAALQAAEQALNRAREQDYDGIAVAAPPFA